MDANMMKPAKNTICLWYDGAAEEAARFYASTFPDSCVTALHRAPADVLTVEFTVVGIPCLGLNGGPAFRHCEAFSFQVATADQAETDRYWNAIVGHGALERCVQRVGHLRVLRVVERRAVHRDGGNAIGHAVEHGLVGFVHRLICARNQRVTGVGAGHDDQAPSTLARRLWGSSWASKASCSGVGSAVVGTWAGTWMGKPVASCTCSTVTPGCRDTKRTW